MLKDKIEKKINYIKGSKTKKKQIREWGSKLKLKKKTKFEDNYEFFLLKGEIKKKN